MPITPFNSIGGFSVGITGTSFVDANGNATFPNVVNTFNGLTGGVTLSAGTNISLVPSGNNITVNYTGSSGITKYVSSFNGLTGDLQGVSAAVAGSGISVSGATGTVTITNTGVTGIQGGTGISVSTTTGNPTRTNIGVNSVQGFTGDVNLSGLALYYLNIGII